MKDDNDRRETDVTHIDSPRKCGSLASDVLDWPAIQAEQMAKAIQENPRPFACQITLAGTRGVYLFGEHNYYVDADGVWDDISPIGPAPWDEEKQAAPEDSRE